MRSSAASKIATSEKEGCAAEEEIDARVPDGADVSSWVVEPNSIRVPVKTP